MTPNTARHPAKRISIFNHKGGVGKTTLTFNIAAAIAAAGPRVLLVDSDPQCNLTAYVIESRVVDDLLDTSDSAAGQTIWSSVRPLIDSTGTPKQISPIELFTKLQILPGDIRLSDFENELHSFWGECFQRKRRGLTGTMALSELVNAVCAEQNIDFVFYDSGPNIGPLNRVILLDCDFFIIPAAYDLFSVRALKTLGRALAGWVQDWSTILELAPKDSYLLPGRPKYLGYIPQNFRVYGGSPTAGHSKYASLLDRSIHTDIVGYLKQFGLIETGSTSKLGEVKDFGALVTASQRDGKPMWQVKDGSPQLRSDARSAFKSIAEKIMRRAG